MPPLSSDDRDSSTGPAGFVELPPPLRASLRAAATGALLWPMLLGIGACGPPPSGAPFARSDLIVIVVDALRADHLGCYGYGRETSPFLDQLCAQGVVYERASAASSFTREAVAAIFTGRLPSKSGALGWHAAPQAPHPTLAESLRAHGFRTRMLSNSVMLKEPGFERGFEAATHLARGWQLSGEGDRLSDAAIDFVRSVAPDRYFLYLHYLDPHAPYRPEERLRARFAAAPAAVPLDLYADVVPDLAVLRAAGFGPGEPRFEDLVARYDAEIASTDAALERLFDGLEKTGALEHALVVITADHGEEFLEHGWVDHGWTLYEESLHVPLVFWAPGQLEPARVLTRASHVDIVPTLLALLGIPSAGPSDGAPLFEIAAAGVRPHADERTQIAELLLPRRQILRTALYGDWKYVATWWQVAPEARGRAPGPPASVPVMWGPPVREEVFDLALDPGEQHNLVTEAEGERADLAAALARFRDTGPNYGLDAGAASRAPAPVSEDDAERLRALGYLPGT